MITIIKEIDKYKNFIQSFLGDDKYSDPMLVTEEQIKCNLLNSIYKKNNRVLGAFEECQLIGLFVFLVEEEEKYLEMLVGLSRSKEVYFDLFTYLKKEFIGYKCDFVFNPRNDLLKSILVDNRARFDKEQLKMKHQFFAEYKPVHKIELLSRKYHGQYIKIHSKDLYWTAEKVVKARDKFTTLIALDGNQVVGYIDFTFCFEENEPYDLFVLPDFRKKEYGKSLLATALEINKPKDMMLLVDFDNHPAIKLYESLGFIEVPSEKILTAHLLIV